MTRVGGVGHNLTSTPQSPGDVQVLVDVQVLETFRSLVDVQVLETFRSWRRSGPGDVQVLETFRSW